MLTSPRPFLISSPEHGTPAINRAFLIDDESRDQHAARYAHPQPAPRPRCRMRARQARNRTRTLRTLPPLAMMMGRCSATALWAALVNTSRKEVSVAELAAASRRTRRWVYHRLQEHAQASRTVQVRSGYWRAARPAGGPPTPPPNSDGL